MAGICPPAGAFISGETIATAAMSVGYTVTCSNMLVKVNDSVATVSGNNAMAYLIGEKNYQAIKDTSEAASNTVFMLGLSNPRLYGTNNNAGNVKENASYQNGKTNLGNEVWESKGGASTSNPYDLQPTHSQTLSNKKMNILIDDIKVNGIQEAIKYVEYNGQMYVVDGHHRLLAAKRLGLTEVLIEEVEIPYAGYSTIDDLLWFD